MKGWIKIYRQITENPLYFSEPFTKMQAWMDLLVIANHKDGIINVRGNIIRVKRGQVGHSERTLSIRWQWSRSKVRNFLEYLKKEKQIEPQKNSVMSLITILNFEMYQEKDHRKTTENGTKKTAEKTTKKTTEKHPKKTETRIYII